MKYAINHNLMHKLCNVAKKNDLLHCDYISKYQQILIDIWLCLILNTRLLVRIYGNEDTKAIWKEVAQKYQASKYKLNIRLTTPSESPRVTSRRCITLVYQNFLTIFYLDLSAEGLENEHLAQVIENCDNAPKTDKEMAKMIRLPK